MYIHDSGISSSVAWHKCRHWNFHQHWVIGNLFKAKVVIELTFFVWRLQHKRMLLPRPACPGVCGVSKTFCPSPFQWLTISSGRIKGFSHVMLSLYSLHSLKYEVGLLFLHDIDENPFSPTEAPPIPQRVSTFIEFILVPCNVTLLKCFRNCQISHASKRIKESPL